MSKTLRIVIAIICIIIAIVVTIVFISSNKNDEKDQVLALYQKMNNDKNYVFTMEEESDDLKYKVSMAQKGSNISIDSYTDDEHTTTLIVDNQVFYVDHDSKEYYYDSEYGADEIDGDIIISSLKSISVNDYVSGKEQIDGNNYYYQEYTDDDANFVIYAEYDENSIVKTRFYFNEDNELKFIKNIVETDKEKEEEILKVTVTYDVNDELFEIPSDYAELED